MRVSLFRLWLQTNKCTYYIEQKIKVNYDIVLVLYFEHKQNKMSLVYIATVKNCTLEMIYFSRHVFALYF